MKIDIRLQSGIYLLHLKVTNQDGICKQTNKVIKK